jgi:hypothetical protein
MLATIASILFAIEKLVPLLTRVVDAAIKARDDAQQRANDAKLAKDKQDILDFANK